MAKFKRKCKWIIWDPGDTVKRARIMSVDRTIRADGIENVNQPGPWRGEESV